MSERVSEQISSAQRVSEASISAQMNLWAVRAKERIDECVAQCLRPDSRLLWTTVDSTDCRRSFIFLLAQNWKGNNTSGRLLSSISGETSLEEWHVSCYGSVHANNLFWLSNPYFPRVLAGFPVCQRTDEYTDIWTDRPSCPYASYNPIPSIKKSPVWITMKVKKIASQLPLMRANYQPLADWDLWISWITHYCER